MSCPSEQTWNAYADDEPHPRELADHLASCSRCRELVRALREENRLLARALVELPLLAPARRGFSWSGMGATLAALVVLAAGVNVVLDGLAGLGRSSPARFVDERQLAFGLLFDAASYVLGEGAAMLESMISAVVVLGLLALGVVVLFSFRRRWAGGALALSALVALAVPSQALELRGAHHKHDRVVVGADEIVDDSLAAAGDAVEVDGIVTGNLLAAARRVIVRGTVKGDLLAAANRVEIEGRVEGNAFVGGDTVLVGGSIGRSLHGAAGVLRLESSGRVEDDLLGLAGTVDLDGRVGRDLGVYADALSLRGEVGRNASTGAGRLHLEAPARIGGNLTARLREAADLEVDPGAIVSGKTETRITPKAKNRYLRPRFYVWRLVWLAAAFLVGFALHLWAPGFLPPRPADAAALLRAAGLGFLALVAAPAAAVLLMITLVGLPAGAIVLGIWLLGLYLSQVLVAVLLGRSLLQRADTPPAALAPALLVGLACVLVAVNLPYLGPLLRLLVLVLGLGLAVTRVRAFRGGAAA
jgi:cytoskeletal protein CcmA (bactofilin family)